MSLATESLNVLHQFFIIPSLIVFYLVEDRQIESRLHMEWKPLGLMDTKGSWFLKIPDRVDWEVNGQVKENLAKKYMVCKHFLFNFYA